MANQGPPAPQPVQQAAAAPTPTLQQGYIQGHEGHLLRKTKILKRWKKEWLKIVPGEKIDNAHSIGWGNEIKGLEPSVNIEQLRVMS